LAGWTAVSGCDEWQTDTEIMAQRSDGFQAHVACSLHGPFIILFEQQRTHQADDGGFVGEDADDLAAPLDLAIEPFKRKRGSGALVLWLPRECLICWRQRASSYPYV
jgi:hypothetical protein